MYYYVLKKNGLANIFLLLSKPHSPQCCICCPPVQYLAPPQKKHLIHFYLYSGNKFNPNIQLFVLNTENIFQLECSDRSSQARNRLVLREARSLLYFSGRPRNLKTVVVCSLQHNPGGKSVNAGKHEGCLASSSSFSTGNA